MSTPPPSFSSALHSQDPNTYHYNSRTVIFAVAALLSIISFVLLLHVYAKWWFIKHSPSRRLSPFVSDRPIQHLSVDLEGDAEAGTGLDASVLASLPIFVYKSDEHKGAEECVICLSALVDEEKGRILPKCRHVFHVGCIDMWLHSHSTCPVCRALVVPGEEAMDVSSIVTVEEVSHDPRLETSSSSHEQAVMTEESCEIVVEVEIPPDLESQMQKDSCSGSLPSSSSSSSSSSSLGCSLKRMLSWNRSESKVFPAADGNGNGN